MGEREREGEREFVNAYKPHELVFVDEEKSAPLPDHKGILAAVLCQNSRN